MPINNIQKTKSKKFSCQDNGVYSYTSFGNELNFKMSTDSYAKILLSDADTIQQLSAIIYIYFFFYALIFKGISRILF